MLVKELPATEDVSELDTLVVMLKETDEEPDAFDVDGTVDDDTVDGNTRAAF